MPNSIEAWKILTDDELLGLALCIWYLPAEHYEEVKRMEDEWEAELTRRGICPKKREV